MLILAMLMGCRTGCECPSSWPVDLVFPLPGATVPPTVVPVFGPEVVGYSTGLELRDGTGAAIPVAATVYDAIWSVLVQVAPHEPLAVGEYWLTGLDQDGELVDITSFIVADMPVVAPRVALSGRVGPDDRGCGDSVDLIFDTEAAWLEVQVSGDPERFRNVAIVPAAPDGIQLDHCRWDGLGADVFVRARPYGVDGEAGGWTEPEEIVWSRR